MLSAPFSRKFAKACDAYAPRQPPIDCGLHEPWREKGQCYCSVDLPDAAGLALGNLLNIFDCSGDQFIEPVSPLRNRLEAETVDAFYKAAIGFGAADDGAPGVRKHYGENYCSPFAIGHRWPVVRATL